MTTTTALSDHQTELHYRTLENCHAYLEKLKETDVLSLEQEKYIEWKIQFDNTRLAILKLQSAILSDISADYATMIAQFEAATTRLVEDLESMKKTNDILSVAGAVTGTITSIITLLD